MSTTLTSLRDADHAVASLIDAAAFAVEGFAETSRAKAHLARVLAEFRERLAADVLDVQLVLGLTLDDLTGRAAELSAPLAVPAADTPLLGVAAVKKTIAAAANAPAPVFRAGRTAGTLLPRTLEQEARAKGYDGVECGLCGSLHTVSSKRQDGARMWKCDSCGAGGTIADPLHSTAHPVEAAPFPAAGKEVEVLAVEPLAADAYCSYCGTRHGCLFAHSTAVCNLCGIVGGCPSCPTRRGKGDPLPGPRPHHDSDTPESALMNDSPSVPQTAPDAPRAVQTPEMARESSAVEIGTEKQAQAAANTHEEARVREAAARRAIRLDRGGEE